MEISATITPHMYSVPMCRLPDAKMTFISLNRNGFPHLCNFRLFSPKDLPGLYRRMFTSLAVVITIRDLTDVSVLPHHRR